MSALRNEFEAAAIPAIHEGRISTWRSSASFSSEACAKAAVDAIWPLVESALEAARADERERIATMLDQEAAAQGNANGPSHWILTYEAAKVRAVSDGN